MTPLEVWEAIPPTLKDQMKNSHELALYGVMQADSRGGAVHTDPDTFLDLYEMATGTPEQVAQFRNKSQTNLRDYVGKLSTAHIVAFAKLQDDENEIAIASTMADLKKEVATTAKFYDNTGKRLDAAGIFKVNNRFDREMKAYTALTGNKATPAVGREIADRLKLSFLRKGRWYGTNPVMAGTAVVEGVPTDYIDEIVFRLTEVNKNNGIKTPPTEEQIKNYYIHATKVKVVPQRTNRAEGVRSPPQPNTSRRTEMLAKANDLWRSGKISLSDSAMPSTSGGTLEDKLLAAYQLYLGTER